MQLGYLQPFSFQIGARPQSQVTGLTVTGVRHGVTEIKLSDGRLVRATLHVKSVKADPNKPDGVEVCYNVVAEIINTPATLIHDVHETLQ